MYAKRVFAMVLSMAISEGEVAMSTHEDGVAGGPNGKEKVFSIDKNALLDKLDIRRYYEAELGSVKWNGNGQGMAKCPFHEDEDPSLSIEPESGVFHCRVCLKEGDVFAFHMAKHQVNFPVALREVAEKGGMETPIKKAGSEQPRVDPALSQEKAAKDYRPEDVGNAERFVDLHGRDLLCCAGAWFAWSGNCWEEDKTLHIYRLASGMQDIVLREAGEETDKKRQKALYKLGSSLGMKKTIDAMISLSRHHVAVTQDVFDRDPYLLNVLNGTVDLRTGQLLPHRREDRITKIAGAAYDPEAACPRWLAFLDTIFCGRQDLIRFVQKAIGYALSGDTGEQCFFILYGTGANGKSTLLDVVQSLLGGYALHSRMETFLAKKNDSIPNDLARLAGARLVTAVEIDKGRRLSESTI